MASLFAFLAPGGANVRPSARTDWAERQCVCVELEAWASEQTRKALQSGDPGQASAPIRLVRSIRELVAGSTGSVAYHATRKISSVPVTRALEHGHIHQHMARHHRADLSLIRFGAPQA